MNGDLTLILRSDLWLDLAYIEIVQECSSSERKGHSKLFPLLYPSSKPREATGTIFKELEVGVSRQPFSSLVLPPYTGEV